MRTREIFRYLVAMIIALSTMVNAMAQERNLKIYFNEHSDTATGPRIYLTDDHPNSYYDVPLDTKVSAEGLTWATGARWFSILQQTVTDRVIADYEDNTKMASHLKISFMDKYGNSTFPYEVNNIQWNIMNDLFSGTIFGNAFDNLQISTICTPAVGKASSYTEEHWELNPFARNTSFTQSEFPSAEGLVLNGLKSFEVSEKNFFKVGIGSLITFYSEQTELDDRCRQFIKAGWNGSKTNNNITDSDDSNWAFKVTFTLPEISAATYTYDKVNKVHVQPDNYVYKNEVNVHAVKGYISAHQGAVKPTYNPNPDRDDFHFEYELKNKTETNFAISRYTGAITKATDAGDYPVIVKLMRGPNREVCSIEYTVHVSEVVAAAQKAEICVGFVDGKKGYDLTLTEKNAQIKGFITKYPKDANNNDIVVTPNENTSGYHFEYSESSNGEIITIDPLTGNITPKKEGDVQITAILKFGNTIYSNPYTYTLHVFGLAEGVDVTKHVSLNSTNELKYIYSNASNQYAYTYTEYVGWPISIPYERTGYKDRDTWKASETYNSNYESYDWQHNNYLRPSTSILENVSNQSNAGQNGWKEIGWYKTTSANYWRAIAQKICIDIRMPKFTTMEVNFSFAGNVNIGTGNGTNSKYGFEVVDLGNSENDKPDKSNKAFNSITWKTAGSGESTSSSSHTVLAQKGTGSNGGYAGDGGNISWSYNETSDSNFGTHRYYTHYLAVMAYLYKDGSYPGEFSVGYKGIPTYTYYTKVKYAKNDGTNTIVLEESEWHTTTSKTETFKLLQGAGNSVKNMTRTGYEFLGWSTDPNATTPDYEKEGDFPIYDEEHGGGWGPVTLYAVWKPNQYIVELMHTSTGPVDGYVCATYNQNMPLVDVNGNAVVVPVQKGYDFNGYFAEKNGDGTKYYNEDMSSNHVWDRVEITETGETVKNYVIARWIPHKTTVVFDPQGGNNNGATRVTATYSAAMPTEGIQAPQREGYTFGGYYSKQNGAGNKYYNADMTSARTWDIDERLLNPPTTEVTLYAKWIGNTYAVTFDKQGGTGGSTSTTATYGQPLPSGLTAPTKEGYEFKGYYSNQNQEYAESMGQDYGGTQYYDKDMNGVEPWDKTQATTIYAHWAPATFIVTFDGTNGAIVPNQMRYYSQKPISDVIYNSDGVVKISFKYGGQCPSQITNGKFKKAAFKLLGFYDSNNVLVATVNVDHPEDRNIYFNESSGYWTKKDGNLVWNCTHDVDLTARYEPKYTVRDGDIIDFGTEYLEVGIDWENSMVHDLLGAAEAEKEAGRISSTNPVMVFDIRNARYLDNSSKKSDDLMVPLRDKNFISPNLLVYLGEGAYDVIENEIKTDGTCPGLVVTDRFPIKIPYAFKAGKALYERNKVQKDNNDLDDAMWKQSHESIWGTLCLPYPIKNNNTYSDVSKVIFYELRKKSGSVMQFKKLPEDAEIPANTPVLYERTVGISSAVTIEENAKDVYDKNTWISVPKNQSYEAEVTSYANATEPSIRDWEFRGNLKTNVFCGKGYINPPAEGILNSDITNNGEVYYFKQNKFTRLTPSMEKNGVHYDAGMMTLYPYRAYFYQKGSSGSPAKVAAYSILVVDEDGATLDITNTVFGDGEGDGKIYDLNGIRVMQPVKGRLYIVNGQKKVYR